MLSARFLEEAEHGDDLVRGLACWSFLASAVDRPRAQAATGAERRAAVEGGWGNQICIMPHPAFSRSGPIPGIPYTKGLLRPGPQAGDFLGRLRLSELRPEGVLRSLSFG